MCCANMPKFWLISVLETCRKGHDNMPLGYNITLGDNRYVQFASLFYIIIYYYSLIYFVFRYDTYVISSIFACLMIIGELTTGVRILLEKGLSRYNILEEQQFPENIQKFLFCQMTEEVRRRDGGGAKVGPHPP